MSAEAPGTRPRLAAVPTVVALPPDLFAALRERLDLAGLRGPRTDGSLDLGGVVAVSAPEAGPPESAETPDAPASTATAASPFNRARAATLCNRPNLATRVEDLPALLRVFAEAHPESRLGVVVCERPDGGLWITSAQGTLAELVYLLEGAKLSLMGVLGGASER